MFVLSVELDEPVRQLLQRSGGRERAVDECAASSLGRDLAAHEQLFSTALEDGLDRCCLFARSYQLARRAPADQESNRFHEDGFAGAGFAREDIEPGVEFDLDGVYDGEMVNTEEAEHAESERTPIVA